MKLHNLLVSGLTEAFPNQVTVNFEALGPGLIALVGENGAGKSTLIGSVFAALFRQLPGQKRSLYDFCTNSQPEIDLTFSVNGNRYRSLLRIDPKSRQMESYLFDSQGVALASGKKDAFQEVIRKRIGTADFFQASIFSNQKRTGNFLGLERSERKQLFITQLLGLERLRLISATARGLAEAAARVVLTLEGERQGIAQLLSTASQIEDIDGLMKELETLGARLDELEQLKVRIEDEQRELEGREIERKGLESRRQDLAAQVDALQRKIVTLRKQVEEDERGLADQHEVVDVAQRARNLNERAEELHRRVEEVQAVEASNREGDELSRSVEADLKTKRDKLERSRVESVELDSVPCGGKGVYAACAKIRRAIQARQELPLLEGTVSTLELELELQRGAVVEVPTTSAQLLRELQECERDRRSLETIRKRHEELRMVQARQAERQIALERLNEEKTGLDPKLQEVLNALAHFEGLQTALNAARERARETTSAIGQCRAERDRAIARQAQAEQRLQQIETARVRETVVELRRSPRVTQ